MPLYSFIINTLIGVPVVKTDKEHQILKFILIELYVVRHFLTTPRATIPTQCQKLCFFKLRQNTQKIVMNQHFQFLTVTNLITITF